MSKYLLVFPLFLAFLFTQEYNPCDDEMYLKVKVKDLNEMSEREFEYWKKLDAQCKDYLKSQQNIQEDLTELTSISTEEPDDQYHARYEGPRFGITYMTGDLPDELSSPILTQFGWQLEKRIFGNEGESIGLIELIGLIGGMEQGLIAPSVTTAFGFRKPTGFEVAVGPNISASGIGYCVAVGFSLQNGGIVFPHNFSIVMSDGDLRLSYILGFNSYKK